MLRKSAFLCPVLYFVISLLVFFADRLDGAVLSPGGSYYLSAVILQFLVFLLPSFVFCRLRSADYLKKLNLRPVGLEAVGITLLSVFLMIAGGWLIRLGQIFLAPGGREASLHFTTALTRSAHVGEIVSSGIAFCLVPAVCEELVFRCVLPCTYFEERYGSVVVGFLTSLLFAMLHFDAAQLAPLFWNGMVLFLMTVVTGSVFPAMIAHFLFNIYAVFGETYVLTMMRSTYSVSILFFVCAVLFLLFLAGFLGQCERVMNEHADLDRPTPLRVTERRRLYPTRADRAVHDLGIFASLSFFVCALFYGIAVFAA